MTRIIALYLIVVAFLSISLIGAGSARAAAVLNLPPGSTSSTPATTPSPTVDSTKTIDAGQLPGTSLTTASALVDLIFSWVPLILGLAAFIGLVGGGFLYLTAGGDPAKAEKARKSLLWSIVGILLASVAFLIVRVVAGSASSLTFPL